MPNLDQRVPVGVGVILRRDHFALVGLRQGSHGADTWAFPGGKPDPGENPREAAVRELYEETGLELHPGSLSPLGFWSYDRFEEEQIHYVTVYFEHRVNPNWVPVVCEPEKCIAWEWKSIRSLRNCWEYDPIQRDPVPLNLFPGVIGAAEELLKNA